MTPNLGLGRLFHIIICLYWQCTTSWSLHSGAWCPYQVEKVVPCRVRNGTEPYYGPNICWKSINGSFSCTKKILHRPKYTTTYKTVFETKYKCCPGMEGANCQNECFNCSSYQNLVYRMSKLEYKFEQSRNKEFDSSPSHQTFVDESILHQNLIHEGDNSLTFIALNTRITSLMHEYKDMESRVRSLEAEVYRLSNLLEEKNRPRSHVSREVIEASPLKKLGHFPDPMTTTTTTTTIVPPSPLKRLITKEPVNSGPQLMRQLEDNLDRGDIASTLNDDYGEELLENSTEQYVDPLLHNRNFL